jgi:predicted porin
MKKTLVALAALTAAGFASADVTIWGTVDLGMTHVSTSNGSSTQMVSGGVDGASKLGFMGTEDLGGGQYGAFYLESGLNPQTGAAQGPLFNRRSTVSFGGGWGELRLGRDFNVTFENFVMGDPFGDHSVAANGDGFQYNNPATNYSTNYFVNNSLKYSYGFNKNDSTWSGTGGLYAEAQYALAGNASGTPASGQYTGGRLGYKVGAFDGAIAAAQSTGYSQVTTGMTAPAIGANGGVKFNEANLFVNYTLPMATLIFSAGNNSSNDPTLNSPKFSHYTVGANIPMGQDSIPLTYSSTTQSGVSGSTANLIGFGYIHNLSKRTAMYGYYSTLKNGSSTTYVPGDSGTSLTAGAGTTVNSFQIGMRTAF